MGTEKANLQMHEFIPDVGSHLQEIDQLTG